MTGDVPAPAPRVARRVTGRRSRTPIIGPLFSWELVRLARRGQDARSRTILSLVLLLTLLVFTVVWFKTTNLSELFFGTQQVLDIKDSSRFAEQFSMAMLLAQMAVMVLLTPAYSAGSIAEEKERRTWQFLMTTELSNREIVLGKFFGRVVFLLGVMMAGLPVLALTSLVGGIDPLFLSFGYLLTGTTVILLAALGITAAIFATTFRGAMFRSYGLAAIYVFLGGGFMPLFSPFGMLVGLHAARADLVNFLVIGCGYLFVQLLVTVIILYLGLRRLRRVERRPPQRFSSRDDRHRKRAVAQAVGTAELKRRDDRWGESDNRTRRTQITPTGSVKPRLGEHDPFTWKEKHVVGSKLTSDDESIRSLMVVIGSVMAIIFGFAVFIAVIGGLGNPDSGFFSQMLIFAGMAGVFTHFLTLGPAACGAVLRERNRLTLESLLTIPVPRTSILAPKWVVTLSRGWWWGGPGMACVVLGLLASEIAPAAFAAAAYFPAAAACCVSVGLWLSCRCANIARAVMIYMSVAGTLAMMPLTVWFVLDDRGKITAVIAMTCLTVIAVAGAWIFWRLSVREFERYGR